VSIIPLIYQKMDLFLTIFINTLIKKVKNCVAFQEKSEVG